MSMQPGSRMSMQPGSRMSMQSGSGGHLVSRGCKLLGGRLLSPLNVALGLGSEILELCQIRRLMKGAIRRAQRHSEALRGTQRHSDALRRTQTQSDALGRALRGNQSHVSAPSPHQCPLAMRTLATNSASRRRLRSFRALSAAVRDWTAAVTSLARCASASAARAVASA